MMGLRGINEFAVKIASWGTIFFMAVIAVVIPYEVVGRYVFARMSTWSGEVSTYSLAWASMLGGAVGLKRGYQVCMTSVLEALSQAAARQVKTVAHLFTLAFLAVMFGVGLFQTIFNLAQTSPAMGITLAIPYASLPLGFLLMFSITLEDLLVHVGLGRKGEPQ